jgi:hypothetical protein
MPLTRPVAPAAAPVPHARANPFRLAPAPQAAPVHEPMVIIDDAIPEPDEIPLEVVVPRASVAARGVSAPPRPSPSAPLPNGGEAQLREALSKASRELIERIAWEVVPQLAETIIRQELDRLIKEREGR